MEPNTNDYQLKQGDKEYIFSTTVVGSSIRLSCKNPAGKLYSRDFTVSDLQSIDQIFNEIKSESDAIDYIDKALKIHKVGVREEEGRIKIVFYVTSGGILNQVEIPLGLADSGSSGANLTSVLLNDAQNSNTQFEHPPHIGPVTEDSENQYTNVKVQAAQTKTVTNPPKFLPTRVLPPRYANSSEQVNASSSFVNTNMNSTSNMNYLQTATTTTSFENNLSSQTAPIDYNANNNQFLQSAPDVTNQIFQNVRPTNDPNTFISPPIKGKVYSSTTHTVAEAQTIYRKPTEMSPGQTDIESILRGSLLSEYEASHIKIVGDPKVVKTEPMREISGMGEEPITTARISLAPITSNMPNNNETTTNPTDFNQYFNQQTSENQMQTTDFNTANYMQSNLQPIPSLGTAPDMNAFGASGTTDMNTFGSTTTTDINAFGTTTTGNDLGALGNFGETTATNVLPSFGGDMSNLQGINLGAQTGYNETNLTQTKYVPNSLEEETRLSLKSQDERIIKLEGDTNLLKNEQQQLQSQLNNLSGEVNSYKNSQYEVNTLRAENEAIKQQLSELNILRSKAQEANILRAQLEQLTPLKQQVQEMAAAKNQLIELNALRAKVAELSNIKAQLGELNNLRQQVGQMNILKQQLDELDALRNKVADNEALKKKIEELENLKLEYEEEIRVLRNAQRNTNTNLETSSKVNMSSAKKSSGMDSKQIMFEDKPEQICVKGDIIHNTDELEMITRRINKLNKKLTLNLLYKASADSDKASAFHSKCDDAQSSLVLVETDKGKRFGGYTTCSWKGDCIDKKDEDAFVFSLDKMKTYDNIPGEDAVGCYPKFGPIFLGCQIRIYDNAFSKGGTTYEKGLNYNTEEDFELTGGDRAFNVREIEVYEVIPQ